MGGVACHRARACARCLNGGRRQGQQRGSALRGVLIHHCCATYAARASWCGTDWGCECCSAAGGGAFDPRTRSCGGGWRRRAARAPHPRAGDVRSARMGTWRAGGAVCNLGAWSRAARRRPGRCSGRARGRAQRTHRRRRRRRGQRLVEIKIRPASQHAHRRADARKKGTHTQRCVHKRGGKRGARCGVWKAAAAAALSAGVQNTAQARHKGTVMHAPRTLQRAVCVWVKRIPVAVCVHVQWHG